MQWLESLFGLSPDVRRPLLTTAVENDIELNTMRGRTAENLSRIRVEHMGYIDHIKGIILLFALLCPTGLVTYVIYDSWKTNPSNRSWLILGLGYYIGAALRTMYELLYRLVERTCFLRVEIRRLNSSTLFEAVSDALAQEAEQNGATCSMDVEALQEHDAITGQYSVRLGFWSSRSRELHLCVSVDEVANNALKPYAQRGA